MGFGILKQGSAQKKLTKTEGSQICGETAKVCVTHVTVTLQGPGKRSAGNSVFPAGYQSAYACARQLAGVSET